MAGVIWGFHRDGNIGRFLITNVICFVLSPNVYWVLQGYKGYAIMYDIHAKSVGNGCCI